MKPPSPRSKASGCDESARQRSAAAAVKDFPPLQERLMGMHREMHDEYDLASQPLGRAGWKTAIHIAESCYDHNLF